MNPAVLWVAFGGAIGSVARYWVDGWITRLAGSAFPWGTLAVNVAGSAAAGAILAIIGSQRSPTHLFAVAGVLGGFTTFSAFSAQTLALAQAGEWPRAAAYVAVSVGTCLFGVWVGYAAGDAWAR